MRASVRRIVTEVEVDQLVNDVTIEEDAKFRGAKGSEFA